MQRAQCNFIQYNLFVVFSFGGDRVSLCSPAVLVNVNLTFFQSKPHRLECLDPPTPLLVPSLGCNEIGTIRELIPLCIISTLLVPLCQLEISVIKRCSEGKQGP